MLNSMAKYTVMEHCSVVEKTLVMELERLWSIWNRKQHDFDQAGSLQSQIGFTVQLTNVWVSYKSGSLISDPIKICDVSTCIYWPCHFVLLQGKPSRIYIITVYQQIVWANLIRWLPEMAKAIPCKGNSNRLVAYDAAQR